MHLLHHHRCSPASQSIHLTLSAAHHQSRYRQVYRMQQLLCHKALHRRLELCIPALVWLWVHPRSLRSPHSAALPPKIQAQGMGRMMCPLVGDGANLWAPGEIMRGWPRMQVASGPVSVPRMPPAGLQRHSCTASNRQIKMGVQPSMLVERHATRTVSPEPRRHPLSWRRHSKRMSCRWRPS